MQHRNHRPRRHAARGWGWPGARLGNTDSFGAAQGERAARTSPGPAHLHDACTRTCPSLPLCPTAKRCRPEPRRRGPHPLRSLGRWVALQREAALGPLGGWAKPAQNWKTLHPSGSFWTSPPWAHPGAELLGQRVEGSRRGHPLAPALALSRAARLPWMTGSWKGPVPEASLAPPPPHTLHWHPPPFPEPDAAHGSGPVPNLA